MIYYYYYYYYYCYYYCAEIYGDVMVNKLSDLMDDIQRVHKKVNV